MSGMWQSKFNHLLTIFDHIPRIRQIFGANIFIFNHPMQCLLVAIFVGQRILQPNQDFGITRRYLIYVQIDQFRCCISHVIQFIVDRQKTDNDSRNREREQHKPIEPLFAHENSLLVQNGQKLLAPTDAKWLFAHTIVIGRIDFVDWILVLAIVTGVAPAIIQKRE